METDMSNDEVALGELKKMQQRLNIYGVVDDQEKAKDNQDRQNAKTIRKKTMETFGHTQKNSKIQNCIFVYSYILDVEL